MTQARPVVFALASMSLFAGACGDAAHDTAKFSTADDAHLRRALDVIRAGDANSLNVVGVFLAGENFTGCPAVTTSGTVTTMTSDCDPEDGVHLTGRIVITNFAGQTGFDVARPSVVEAHDWRSTSDTIVEWIDGTVSTTRGDGPDDPDLVEATIDSDLGGITAHTDLGFTCDATDLCTMIDGSWIDVETVGAATVTGSFRYDEPPVGAITATGAETLVIDIAASINDCLVFRIDGTPREFCDRSKPSRGPAPFAFAGDAHLPRPLAR